MPMQTFFNLSKERQKEIIDVCLEEFSFHPYKDASLTRIIQKLGIAKGSFYRYFKTKKDVYTYLIVYGKGLNKPLFQDIFIERINDFPDVIDAWAAFYLAAVKQDNEYPLLSYFGYQLVQDRHNIVFGDMVLRTKRTGQRLLRNIFSDQQKNGKIRSDIDPDVAIFTLLQMQSGFVDYLAVTYGIDFKENIRKRKPLFSIPEAVIEEELRKFAQVIRNGIGCSHGEKET